MKPKILGSVLIVIGLSLSGTGNAYETLIILKADGARINALIDGNKLQLRDATGKRWLAASDGTYKTGDGRTLIVQGGVIAARSGSSTSPIGSKPKTAIVGPMFSPTEAQRGTVAVNPPPAQQRGTVEVRPPSGQVAVAGPAQVTVTSPRPAPAKVPVNVAAPGAQVGDEDCVAFNPANTRAALVQGNWRLVDGSNWIADFRNKQAEAQKAEQIVKRYKLTKQCFVGRPNPSMTYWLAGDQSPSKAMQGEDCIGFKLSALHVSATGGKWRVADDSHPLFGFPSQAEAQQALKMVKHHGFTQSCFVGRPDASMTYMRK